MIEPRPGVPGHHGVVEGAVPGRPWPLRGRSGSVDGALALGDGDVVGVDHAPHALAHDVEIVQLGVDEGARGRRRRGPWGRSAWG